MEDKIVFEGLEKVLGELTKEELCEIIMNKAQESAEFRNELFLNYAKKIDEAFMYSFFSELSDLADTHRQTAIELSEDIMRSFYSEESGGCSGCCSSCSSCGSCEDQDEFDDFDDDLGCGEDDSEEHGFDEDEDEKEEPLTDEEIETAFNVVNDDYEVDIVDFLDRYVPDMLEKGHLLSAFDLVSAAMHEALSAEYAVSLFSFPDLGMVCRDYLADILKECNEEQKDAIFDVVLDYVSYDSERNGMRNSIYNMAMELFDKPEQKAKVIEKAGQ